jgi:uncharacterized membrane protein YfcA
MDLSYILIIQVLLIGILAGIFSGLFGIGGGIIIVPALMYFLGYSQKLAQGTTLFMLMLPVVALGAYKYYQEGNMSYRTGLIMGAGFFIGGFIGAQLVHLMPNTLKITSDISVSQPMTKLFALLVIFLGFKLLLGK